MYVINVELYSIVILVILLFDYVRKFRKKFNTASLLWLALVISTILIALSNIFLTLSGSYEIRLISTIVYLLSTLLSSLFVYIYVKLLYIEPNINLKKEMYYILLSVLACISLTIIYLFFTNSGYIAKSFNRTIFNQLLIFAIVPNIMIFIMYIYSSVKNNIRINHNILLTLLITICGLILDIKYDTLFFVSSSFTITALIVYINKYEALVNSDPLTGLTDKTSLERYIANLKGDNILIVYNIVVDKFEKINEKYGYIKGDNVLKSTANILRNSSKVYDLVTRNGINKFLILAKVSDEQNAVKILNRIKSNLKQYNRTNEIKINLSIGWGVYHIGDNSNIDIFNEYLKSMNNTMNAQKEFNDKKFTHKNV